jgi:hypothetical protein
MDEFLAFVRKIGNTLDGKNIYEFMFTTVPDVVWGDNFNIIPAGIIPNLIPENNCLSRKGRVITDIDFKLACESTCFSMMDSIDGIISLCFTEAGIEQEFHFDFGDEYNDVLAKLKKYNLELADIEDIKLYDDSIVDDVVKQLEDEENGNIDDIW